MNTHEFQGKSLLRAYNVDIQEGFVATTPDQAIMIANQLREKFNTQFLVKAQIHAEVVEGGGKTGRSVGEAGKIAERCSNESRDLQTGPAGERSTRS
jgi:succinyl-CoA synthetase beta subunit